MNKKIEKVVLVALTEKEVNFINSLTRPIHNRLLEEDRKRGYVTQHSDETRTLTGSIGKKLLFQSYSAQPNKKYCAPQCRWSYNDKHKKEKHRGVTLPFVPERFIVKDIKGNQ